MSKEDGTNYMQLECSMQTGSVIGNTGDKRDMDIRTSYTTCPLCEATCGLAITTRGREILSIRGDEQDVFSHGYLCPKAYSLKELNADPDCIRAPMIRRGDAWQTVGWHEAFTEIEQNLTPLLSQHG